MATKIVELCTTHIVCETRGDSVVCNISVNLKGLSDCNHEEADTRRVVHARHSAVEERTSVMIKANDIDVIGINVSPLLIGLEKLWIDLAMETI